eukprot:m.164983 g.164983  ORF g.164983 m.164983 type:complete len:504 (+) comp15251_c0_seq4:224-1735(+)
MSDEEAGGFGSEEEEEEEEEEAGGFGDASEDEEDEEQEGTEEEDDEDTAGFGEFDEDDEGFGALVEDDEEETDETENDKKAIETGDVGYRMASELEWFRNNNTPKYQLQPINASLLEIRSALQKKCCQIFIYICRWMGITAKVGKGQESTMKTAAMIVTPGLVEEDLRDETFCQIMKQLSGNPSKNSRARGVILITLVLGCYTPSDKLIPTLRKFIDDGPPGYALYQNVLLRRTTYNGSRAEPPCTLELQAAKRKLFLRVSVMTDMMTGKQVTARLDPASVNAEWVEEIAMKEGIKNHESFSIFVDRFNNLRSLRGAGGKGMHVMDIVSKIDQAAEKKSSLPGQSQQDLGRLGGQLYFRADLFKKNADYEGDPKGTEIIYHQIQAGIRSGEFVCKNNDEYLELAAMMYYIEFGDDVDARRVEVCLIHWFPASMAEKDIQKNIASVEKLHAKAIYQREGYSKTKTQAIVINKALAYWGQDNSFVPGTMVLMSNKKKQQRRASKR